LENLELKGYLKPVILKILSEEDGKTGSELAEYIGEKIGSKPSYGSVYPILKDMNEKGLLDSFKDGKEKRYSLLEKGEIFVEEMEHRKTEYTEKAINLLKTFKTIFEDREVDLLIESIERKCDEEAIPIPEILQIHHLLITRESVDQNRKEVRGRLRETLEDLKKILGGDGTD